MDRLNCLRCEYEHKDNGNCTAVGGFCTAVPAAHCKKLKEYLDTGLTPEEIIGLCENKRAKMADLLRLEEYQSLGDIARLRQLAEADRDGRIVVMDEPVNISYKSQLSNLSELLEDATEKIEDRCRAWMCIYQRAENDLDKIKGDIGLTAYKECLTMVDSIGQKCAEAEAALAGEERQDEQACTEK